MLLAIDTSTRWIGLGVYDGSLMAGEMLWQTQNHHTVELAPAVEDLLKRCGVEKKSLKALAVALGPGSFTSLRIGLALVKGLSMGLSLPVVGIPTLDILAANIPVQEIPLLAALQAGRGRFGVSRYNTRKSKWVSQDGANVMTLEDVIAAVTEPTVVCGEFSAADRQALKRGSEHIQLASPSQCIRRPAVLAEMAWARWQKGRTDDLAALKPIYLHVGQEIPS